MENQSELITNIQRKYQDYVEKVNLTDQAKTPQLAIIALIYPTTSPNNRKQIDKRLLEVQKVLDVRLRGQSWLSFLSKTNQVVSLDQVWKQIAVFKNDPRENLIRDVCQLKKLIT